MIINIQNSVVLPSLSLLFQFASGNCQMNKSFTFLPIFAELVCSSESSVVSHGTVAQISINQN